MNGCHGSVYVSTSESLVLGLGFGVFAISSNSCPAGFAAVVWLLHGLQQSTSVLEPELRGKLFEAPRREQSNHASG